MWVRPPPWVHILNISNIRDSLMVRIRACRVRDRGSIPRRGVFLIPQNYQMHKPIIKWAVFYGALKFSFWKGLKSNLHISRLSWWIYNIYLLVFKLFYCTTHIRFISKYYKRCLENYVYSKHYISKILKFEHSVSTYLAANMNKLT